MYAWVKQSLNDPTQGSRVKIHDLCSGGSLWEPMIVQTIKERDYLLAMQLMVGNSFEVCVDGIDKPKRDTPPTWVSIPNL